MKIEQYADDIKFQLGSPVVSLEIKDDHLYKIIDMAFREVKNYITDTTSVTLPFSNKIHINNFKDENGEEIRISSVIFVARGNSPYVTNVTDNDAIFMSSLYSNGITSGTSMSEYYSRSLMYNQIKNTLSTDLDFEWDKKNNDLYINCNFPKPNFVTIFYNPEYRYIEEVTEPFWENIIRRLSLALTKQILGRIRSKYKVDSASYQLDGDTLLSESQSELTEIREFLKENSDLALPID